MMISPGIFLSSVIPASVSSADLIQPALVQSRIPVFIRDGPELSRFVFLAGFGAITE
jgi:hypothetical protein